MLNYTVYDFYKKSYIGNLTSEEFEKNIAKASREIDKNINKILTKESIEELSEHDKYKLNYVACELCDYYNQMGNNASSISIDGVRIDKSAKTEEQLFNEKISIVAGLPDCLTRFL